MEVPHLSSMKNLLMLHFDRIFQHKPSSNTIFHHFPWSTIFDRIFHYFPLSIIHFWKPSFLCVVSKPHRLDIQFLQHLRELWRLGGIWSEHVCKHIHIYVQMIYTIFYIYIFIHILIIKHVYICISIYIYDYIYIYIYLHFNIIKKTLSKET